MGDLRQKMLPKALNMLLFLKANHHLWTNAKIVEAILIENNLRNVIDSDADTADGERY